MPNRNVPAGTNQGAPIALERAEVDQGLIERPMFCPHLSLHSTGGDGVLLVSEVGSYALYGRLYRRLADLIDGFRDRHTIVATLAADHSVLSINTALVKLATKGYIVSADTRLGPTAAAFWSALGVSPALAERRLAERRVGIVRLAPEIGEPEVLLASLREYGVQASLDSDDADVLVALVRDYLDGGLVEFDHARRRAGQPWLPVRPSGVAAMVGPVFVPDNGPCLACLTHRMRVNRELKAFVERLPDQPAEMRPGSVGSAAFSAVQAIAAIELAKWLGRQELSHMRESVLAWRPLMAEIDRHPVRRRPQCPECGDPALRSPDREPAAIRLVSRPHGVHTSGGMRSVPPTVTLERYEHLVSPISGVISGLLRTTPPADDWLHSFSSGQNMAVKDADYRLTRLSLRSFSGGKGTTDDQARASAMCESLERHSGVYHGDEIRRRCRFVDFAPGEAIGPDRLMQFSSAQYADREAINAMGRRFYLVPEPFDPERAIDWTPVWSLTAQSFRWLPLGCCYYGVPIGDEPQFCAPDSNGAAAGNSLEEAVVQGFLELVERDAFGIWWYNRLRVPRVDLASFGDPYLARTEAVYSRFNRDFWLLDVTSDLGIPAFVSISRRIDKPVEDILYASGAHLDPRLAALRAVTEHNQHFPAVMNVDAEGNHYGWDDPEANEWWRTATLSQHPYLAPDLDQRPRTAADFQRSASSDFLTDIERMQALVEAQGFEVLVHNQTRPDLEMPVAKVIVPGLRHFWPRFAPGRLYDVPVATGQRDQPIAEEDLNPVPVFI